MCTVFKYMSANTATVSGNGVVVRQKPVSGSWLDECLSVCQRPGPQQIKGVHRTLRADDLTPISDGAVAQVFRKDGLGMTDDITVAIDLSSFCGPAVHWNNRLKRCVPDKVPASICGEGTSWDSGRGQCLRSTGCAKGYMYGGNLCLEIQDSNGKSAATGQRIVHVNS